VNCSKNKKRKLVYDPISWLGKLNNKQNYGIGAMISQEISQPVYFQAKQKKGI
jgi:hypothetical protein